MRGGPTDTSRRRFLRASIGAGLALVSAAPLSACLPVVESNPRPSLPRLGFLALTSLADYGPHLDAFRNGMRALGRIEGEHHQMVYRFADGSPSRLNRFAQELVEARVDVIVAAATEANQAALEATRQIPIVMTNSGDPIATGLVKSLAEPGGNLTGLTSANRELAGKRLELLSMAIPGLSRVAVIWNDAAARDYAETQAAAERLGIQVRSMEVRGVQDVELALANAARENCEALIAIPTATVNNQRSLIASFGLRHNLPGISEQRQFVEAGGLLAYGANELELYRRAATYVDRILSGVRPADLPVERAGRFDFIINLGTARALGLTVSTPVLIQATEVLA